MDSTAHKHKADDANWWKESTLAEPDEGERTMWGHLSVIGTKGQILTVTLWEMSVGGIGMHCSLASEFPRRLIDW